MPTCPEAMEVVAYRVAMSALQASQQASSSSKMRRRTNQYTVRNCRIDQSARGWVIISRMQINVSLRRVPR
jgi:hypothetical protein